MKKSNKLSVVYILCSVTLFAGLLFGGIYGIYISVGLNFVRSSVSNVADVGSAGANNVAFGGTVNFESSMTGVIILSIALIVIAIFDLISLIKQIILFKQFKMVRTLKFEKSIEKKVKSKGSVVFFAVLIDIFSIIAGVVGIVINARAFVGNNISWVLYVADGAVALLALVSLVLLIVKLKQSNSNKKASEKNLKVVDEKEIGNYDEFGLSQKFCSDIDNLEYALIKLKYLKSTKIINADEYSRLREKFLKTKQQENLEDLD